MTGPHRGLGPEPAEDEATGPTEADRREHAAWNDDWHTEEETPDDVYDFRADEVAALDRYERGLCC
jgi:hypothetical protein